jgi:hypothetical protein
MKWHTGKAVKYGMVENIIASSGRVKSIFLVFSLIIWITTIATPMLIKVAATY